MSRDASTFYHQAVMKEEAVSTLEIKKGGIYVDATLGGGGHTRAILEALGDEGRLVVFDQDSDAWPNAPDDRRVILVKENFKYMNRFLRLYHIERVDGVLADLGVSSFQFDEGGRGFSIRFDGPLDMRMDKRQSLTATQVLQEYSETDLHLLFERYGEVRNAKTLARLIVEERRGRNLEQIADFKAMIAPCIKGKENRYLAQVFQALRIEVNDELGVLRSFLEQAEARIAPGGKLVVITFHSLEDRLVKQFMKFGNFDKVQKKDVYGQIIGSIPFEAEKVRLPEAEECARNPRARSSKLRVARHL